MLGYVEEFARDVIRGWAFDPGQPARRLTVELLIDGRCVSTAPATIDRPDLASIGQGRTDLGFALPVRPQTPLDAEHVEVRILGTGEPVSFDVAAWGHEGVLELVTPTQVGGWAWHIGHPREHPRLVVRHQGREVAPIVANQFRGDLLAAGIGDGQFGFYCDLPVDLSTADLGPTQLQVVVESTQTAIFDMRSLSVEPVAKPVAPTNPVEGPPTVARRSAPTRQAPLPSPALRPAPRPSPTAPAPSPVSPPWAARQAVPPAAPVTKPPPPSPPPAPPREADKPSMMVSEELAAALRSALPLGPDEESMF